MYEKPFTVTSSEYNYSGVDVVILKMVEFREKENGTWHSFYSSSSISITRFSGVNYYYVITKGLNEKTKKIRVSGNITWGDVSNNFSQVVDIKIENGFSTNIFENGSNQLSVSVVLNSSSPHYYSIDSNVSATITNFVLDEYY